MHWLIATVLLLCLIETALTLECGIAKDPGGESSRIVGGYTLKSYTYPWFASFHSVGRIQSQICAGTLITVRHVLTAGHCFQPTTPIALKDMYEVSLGMFDVCSPGPTRRTFNIARVVVHENFVDVTKFDDVTVVTLDVDDTGFMPVCLPPAGQSIRHEKNALIMGFGLTAFKSDDRPCVMSEAKVVIYTKDECLASSMPQDENNAIADTEKVFCAGKMTGGIDTCQGDSGGGLILKTNGRYVARGIVSFGYGCATKGEPGVYTNVAYYLNWINRTIVNEQTRPPGPVRNRPHPIRDIFGYLLG